MKTIFTLAFGLFVYTITAQSLNPGLLVGSWKISDKALYERWDLLNNNSLSGFSYKIDSNGLTLPLEYLSLEKHKKGWLYKAKVLGQNEGGAISFYQQKCDTAILFVNPHHNFPQQISYHPLDSQTIRVSLIGRSAKTFVYYLERCDNKSRKVTDSSSHRYDAELAARLGADDYGMKSYFLVVLKTGAYQSNDAGEIRQAFKSHMQNIEQLTTQGNLIVAGPLGKNERQYRGIFILAVQSLEEAKACLGADGAIQKGFLAYDVYNWYGSAALPLYLPEAEKIWKVKP